MQSSIQDKDLCKAAFHLGILSQLIDQSDASVVGAHSLSGVTKMLANLPSCIINFMENPCNSNLCDLALLGLNAFDTNAQENWIKFISNKDNNSSLGEIKTHLESLTDIEKAHWFLFYFSSKNPPLAKEILGDSLNDQSKFLNSQNQAFKLLHGQIENAKTKKELLQKKEDLIIKSHSFLDQIMDFKSKSKYTQSLLNTTFLSLVNSWDFMVKTMGTAPFLDKTLRESYFKQGVDKFL